MMIAKQHVWRHIASVVVGLLSTYGLQTAAAQARSTASGPGSFIAIGGGASAFKSDYGQQTLAGGFVFADIQPTWRFGVELEARSLRLHNAEQLTESSYLAGVRATWRPEGLSPYVKFLAGDGHIGLPFGYGEGDYLALAPGAGLEYNPNRPCGSSSDRRGIPVLASVFIRASQALGHQHGAYLPIE